MYSLLVVDDVMYAAQAIAEGVDWSQLHISEVHVAYEADSAMQLLRDQAIDVMICDIEMPEKNGLVLLQWVREHSPHTETIFVTAHAEFAYAQQAIQLGSFDYVLKPVKHDQLLQIVMKALDRVKKGKEVVEFAEIYSKYQSLWQNQLPILVERFWQDIVAQRTLFTKERLASSLQIYGIPLCPDSRLVPLLISVEHWKEDLSIRDEEIMEYALRNVASEIFLRDIQGYVVQDRAGINFVLFHEDASRLDSKLDKMSLVKTAKEYMKICKQLFHCQVSCYLGDPVELVRLAETYHQLLNLETRNVSGVSDVYLQSDEKQVANPTCPLPPFSDWTVLLETRQEQEIGKRIEEYFTKLTLTNPMLEQLEGFFFGFAHMVYHVCQKRGSSVQELTGSRELTDCSVNTRSAQQLKAWACKLVTAVFELLNRESKGGTVVIEKVRLYIAQHLAEEMTRQDIASHIHLNPAYLSRMFKKETSQSLSDYIIQERLARAKRLLEESNKKIVHIAEEVGYNHFPHFTTMFKKVVGVTPQQYRKQYQELCK